MIELDASERRRRLLRQLVLVRRRGISGVDVGGVLKIADLLEIVDSVALPTAASLRRLIADAIGGYRGHTDGIADPILRDAALRLFGLDGERGTPNTWRSDAARIVGIRSYFDHDGSLLETRWRDGHERVILELVAAEIDRIAQTGPYVMEPPIPSPPLPPPDPDRVTLQSFLSARRTMSARPKALILAALELHDAVRADREVPLLTRSGWIPPAAIPLRDVQLDWVDGKAELANPRTRLVELGYWPTVAGRTMSRYSAAVERFDRPPNFFDGTSYRLVDVAPSPGAPRLTLAGTTYFEHFDTSEALLFEAAWVLDQSVEDEVDGPYRQWLGNPFDLRTRCTVPGINTLTVRRSRDGQHRFYLVERGNVATAMGTIHVIPAGEFQPSRDGEASPGPELRIAATMIREYAEELLGLDEARDHRLPPIDVETDEPFCGISDALSTGAARAWYLGIGLYPVTWKPEIITTCVFDDEVFDELFAAMIRTGTEGDLMGADERLPATTYSVNPNRPYAGLLFTERNVRAFARNPNTLPAGRACLELAWRHREQLGLA